MAKLPIDVTVRTKGEEALDRLNKRFEAWGKNSERINKPLGAIEKSLGRILKPWGLEKFTRDFGRFGEAASTLGGAFGGELAGMGGFGEALAGMAGPITLAIGGAGALGSAAVTAGYNFDQSTAALSRFSRTVEMSMGSVQGWIDAAGQMGAKQSDIQGALKSVHDSFADAYERPQVAQILHAEGRATPAPNAPVDTNKEALWLSDIVRKQPTMALKKRVLESFGVSDDLLPYFDQGGAQIKQQVTQSNADHRPASPDEAKKAEAGVRSWANAGQSAQGLARAIGSTAADWTAPLANAAEWASRHATKLVDQAHRHPAALSSLPALTAAFAEANLRRAERQTGRTIDVSDQMAKLHPDAAANGGAAGGVNLGDDKWRRAGQVRDMLARDLRLTPAQAAGIVSNLAAESGLRGVYEDPRLAAASGHPGDLDFGWAQWHGERKDAMMDWSKSQGLDPRSDTANYGFLLHEIQTRYAGLLDQVRQTSDPRAAALTFSPYETGGSPRNMLFNPQHAAMAEQIAALPPQKVEVSVTFANAPPGTTARATGSTNTKIALEIGHSMPYAGR
jgi:Phage tail lysozyme